MNSPAHAPQRHPTPVGPGGILVVGHSGFIGRHVMAELLSELGSVADDVPLSGASSPECDLTDDSCLDALARRLEQTTIVFLAGIKRQLGDTLDTFEANVKLVANFCRCLQRRPARRVVYVSSAAVYGEELDNRAITEDTAVRPTSLYGIAKATSEDLFRQAVRSGAAASLAIVRPPLIYGPGDTSASYGPNAFCRSAIDDVPVTLWGDGTERREFLHVGDAARLIVRLAVGTSDGPLNLASGRSHSYVDVVNVISSAIGRPVTTLTRPRTKPTVDHGFTNTRLQTLFPDFRFTSLEEGVRQTLAAQASPGTIR